MPSLGPDEAFAFEFYVTDARSVEHAIETTHQCFGAVHVNVNTAVNVRESRRPTGLFDVSADVGYDPRVQRFGYRLAVGQARGA